LNHWLLVAWRNYSRGENPPIFCTIVAHGNWSWGFHILDGFEVGKNMSGEILMTMQFLAEKSYR
jgi:hypothetical protein